MQQLNGDFLVIVGKRAELLVFAALALQRPAAVLALVALRVIQLLNLIVRKGAISILAIASLPAL